MGNSNIKVPFEPTEKFFKFLKNKIKLNNKKAFKVIYYLQEYFKWDDENGTNYGLLPDTFEQCQKCKDIYDSSNSGCLAMLCGGCYNLMCPHYNDNIECEDCKLYKKLYGFG